MTTKQAFRTRTDFLCLTISAGVGREESSPAGQNYVYRVQVQSDATSARTSFVYHASINDHAHGIDQLDKEGLLYAFWSFVMDAQAGDQSFDDFTSDYGYPADSMTAHRTWQACQRALVKFNRLFHDAREPSWALEMLAHEDIE